jgi:hypothetical protein
MVGSIWQFSDATGVEIAVMSEMAMKAPGRRSGIGRSCRFILDEE